MKRWPLALFALLFLAADRSGTVGYSVLSYGQEVFYAHRPGRPTGIVAYNPAGGSGGGGWTMEVYNATDAGTLLSISSTCASTTVHTSYSKGVPWIADDLIQIKYTENCTAAIVPKPFASASFETW